MYVMNSLSKLKFRSVLMNIDFDHRGETFGLLLDLSYEEKLSKI